MVLVPLLMLVNRGVFHGLNSCSILFQNTTSSKICDERITWMDAGRISCAIRNALFVVFVKHEGAWSIYETAFSAR
jgi:hypothetical protein